MPKPYESDETLAAFIRGFEEGTYPKAHWTHEAHVVMAAWYLTGYPLLEATRRIRAAIPAYNVAQGGQNTATSGYHETLTVFWIWIVAGFLASLPGSLTRRECIAAAALRFGEERRLHQRYYGHDVMADQEARRAWVMPELWRRTIE